jgi:hypothetical protein
MFVRAGPPLYSPELNAIEWVWFFLREQQLSRRMHEDDRAALDAVGAAYCEFTPKRLSSLCNHPWIRRVSE